MVDWFSKGRKEEGCIMVPKRPFAATEAVDGENTYAVMCFLRVQFAERIESGVEVFGQLVRELIGGNWKQT